MIVRNRRITPARAKKTEPDIRLLFTCIGRRVELVRAFRAAAERLRIRLEIHGGDSDRLAPALSQVDHVHLLPGIASGHYTETLAELIRSHHLSLLIPLIDTELPAIAANREQFTQLGCRTVISSPAVVETCRDKLATYRMLTDAKIDTPKTWRWSEIVNRNRHRFPYYLKPRAGSAAMGNYVVRNHEELVAFGNLVKDPIVQEFVLGDELTVDVYCGFDGVPRCIIPRLRLEVRGGEVTKGVTVRDAMVSAAARRVARELAECRGVITVQCMKTPDGRVRVIEINPRFGGGVPLAIHAGADFPRWILEEHLGRKPAISADYEVNLAMLRFDDSVFVKNATTTNFKTRSSEGSTRSPSRVTTRMK
ncbi:MAG: ATP-grasp domain-containing protein [Planctomycetes bacterium]|nr:ATP-grasp domain-containing protein [Planctomycetota bacterium]MBI3834885.1 ATP-grasp domain-containing protein [Planctomycetota bacterium]